MLRPRRWGEMVGLQLPPQARGCKGVPGTEKVDDFAPRPLVPAQRAKNWGRAAGVREVTERAPKMPLPMIYAQGRGGVAGDERFPESFPTLLVPAKDFLGEVGAAEAGKGTTRSQRPMLCKQYPHREGDLGKIEENNSGLLLPSMACGRR